jgi:hypothetical protein
MVLEHLATGHQPVTAVRPSLICAALLFINEKTTGVTQTSKLSFFQAAYADVSEPSSPQVTLADFAALEVLVSQLQGDYQALRNLRRRMLRHVHPDIVPKELQSTAVAFLKRVNISIDSARTSL